VSSDLGFWIADCGFEDGLTTNPKSKIPNRNALTSCGLPHRVFVQLRNSYYQYEQTFFAALPFSAPDGQSRKKGFRER
jgi:hypothetical protein